MFYDIVFLIQVQFLIVLHNQVRYLGVAGGKDTGDSTRSVLVRLMKATVARSCNWAGKGGKTAFGQMNLHSIVCGKFLNIVLVFFCFIGALA